MREPVYTKNAAGEAVFSGMGPVKRTVTGSGVFFGENAYADFRQLLALYNGDGCGALVHPVWGTLNAYFTELVLTQEPKSNYVAYKFEFREADADGNIPE